MTRRASGTAMKRSWSLRGLDRSPWRDLRQLQAGAPRPALVREGLKDLPPIVRRAPARLLLMRQRPPEPDLLRTSERRADQLGAAARAAALLPEPLAAEVVLDQLDELPPRRVLAPVDHVHRMARLVGLDAVQSGGHAHGLLLYSF